MQETFEVELPDGTVISGPTKEAALIAARRKLGVKEVSALVQTPTEAAKSLLPSTEQEIRPYASGAVGIGTGLLTANPLAGTAAMEATNYLLRKLHGEKSNFPISNAMGVKPALGDYPGLSGAQEVGENTAVTELLGKLISYPLKKAGNAAFNFGREVDASDSGLKGVLADVRDKALGLVDKNFNTNLASQVGKGSVVKSSLLNLDPTYAQYDKNVAFADLVEDVFAKSKKKVALENSATKTYDKSKDLSVNLTGRAFKEPEVLGKAMAAEATSAFNQSIVASNLKAEAVKMNAKQNLVPVTRVVQGQGPLTFNVEGPIQLTNTLTKAKELYDDISKSGFKPDPDDPFVKKITDLFESVNAKFDKDSGQLVSFEPMSFDSAWKTKQISDSLGYGGGASGLNYQDSRFIQLSKAMNDDIDKGIDSWKVNSLQAKDSWNKAKQIVQSRIANFTPAGEKGVSVKELLPMRGQLKNVNNPIPALDTISDDPNKLGRFLGSAGTFKAGNETYAVTNAAADMRGYKFMSIFRKAWTETDPSDPSKGFLNADKLITDWNNYANSEAGKKLYNAKQRADITQFFRDASYVSDPSLNKGNSGLSRYLTLRLGSGVLRFGGAMAAALVGTSELSSVGIGTGVTLAGAALTLNQLGKLMTNPDTARLMIAMTKGSPLEMSTHMAGRFIANALKNQPISMQLSDGTEVAGKFNAQSGKFQANFDTSNITIKGEK